MSQKNISEQIKILFNQYAIKNFDNVISKCKILIKKNPEYIILYNLIGSAYQSTGDYLNANKSFKDGVRKLIIVTGKGLHSKNEADPFVSKDLSILKYSVPEFIKNNTNLMKKIIELKDAEIADGGSGAFYIYLRRN